MVSTVSVLLVRMLSQSPWIGLPAAAAGIHAYIADCTDVSNRWVFRIEVRFYALIFPFLK